MQSKTRLTFREFLAYTLTVHLVTTGARNRVLIQRYFVGLLQQHNVPISDYNPLLLLMHNIVDMHLQKQQDTDKMARLDTSMLPAIRRKKKA